MAGSYSPVLRGHSASKLVGFPPLLPESLQPPRNGAHFLGSRSQGIAFLPTTSPSAEVDCTPFLILSLFPPPEQVKIKRGRAVCCCGHSTGQLWPQASSTTVRA